MPFRITGSEGSSRWDSRIELRYVRFRQGDIEGGKILLKMDTPLGPRKGHDIGSLGEHEGERELSRGTAFSCRDGL
jgi:hypothetical protein